MENISSLNKINRSDTDLAGFKAVDLADLYDKKINIPICFVIKSSLFEEFVEKNSLRPQIQDILKDIDYTHDESLEQAYDKIKRLFSESQFTEENETELLESYETLAIDMDHIDIAKLVTAIDKPYLTMIGSPNYVQDSENNESIFQNVKGKVALLNGIKNCWASLYTPNELKYRIENNIETKEKMAIIIQRMVEAQISAQTFTDDEEIIVKSFIGYQDYYDEFEKDITVFSKGNLSIKTNKANFQEYQYSRDLKDNNLVKKALKTEGEKQKLNDKDLEELARITKKIEGFLEKPVKVFVSLTKGKTYVIVTNRIVRKKKERVAEEEVINQESSSELEKPVPEEEINIEEDVKFLDEIESYEKTNSTNNSQKNSDWSDFKEDKKEPKEESEFTQEPELIEPSEEESIEKHEEVQEPEEMPIQQKEPPFESDEAEKLESISTESVQQPVVPEGLEKEEEIQAEQPVSTQNAEPIEEHNTETSEQPAEPEPMSIDQLEEELDHTGESEEAQNTEASDKSINKPNTDEEDKPVDLEDSDEGDNFIFSQYEEKEDKPGLTEEKTDEDWIKPSEPEDDWKTPASEEEKQNTEPTDETKIKSDDNVEEETKEITDEPKSETAFERVVQTMSEMVILCDDAIYDVLKKKNQDVLHIDPSSFEEAIHKLKEKVRIPFLEEIKKVHEIRQKVDAGEKVDVDQTHLVLRNAKNFLNLFE